jgi:hypothetical protein
MDTESLAQSIIDTSTAFAELNAHLKTVRPQRSRPWLRKMGRACGFTSGRDSSAERRIRRMIANAIQIETARLANLCDEDARA